MNNSTKIGLVPGTCNDLVRRPLDTVPITFPYVDRRIWHIHPFLTTLDQN